MTDQKLPEQIGKYRIQAILGRGAMGVVYQGLDPHIERRVAIKVIRKGAFAEDELHEALQRFRREAQAAGRLLHPNIVTIYEYGEEKDTAFIAMEYVEETPSRTVLPGVVPLPWPKLPTSSTSSSPAWAMPMPAASSTATSNRTT